MSYLFKPENIKKILFEGVQDIVTSLCPEDLSTTPADRSFRCDCHLHREILFIIEGESLFMLNGMTYQTRPGTAFFLNNWEPHSYCYRQDDHNVLHLWLYLSLEKIYGSLLHTDQNGHHARIGKYVHLGSDLHRLLNRRWNQLEQKAPCSAVFRDQLLRSTFNAVLEEFALLQFSLVESAPEQISDISVFLHNYIKSVNGRDCSLEQLEKLTGYSRFYLSRLFKKHWRITVGDYINQIRLEFVKEAMKREMKQKEIAYELGFSSPATFWFWLNKNKGVEN